MYFRSKKWKNSRRLSPRMMLYMPSIVTVRIDILYSAVFLLYLLQNHTLKAGFQYGKLSSRPDRTARFLLCLRELVLAEKTRIKETFLSDTVWRIIFLTENQPSHMHEIHTKMKVRRTTKKCYIFGCLDLHSTN